MKLTLYEDKSHIILLYMFACFVSLIPSVFLQDQAQEIYFGWAAIIIGVLTEFSYILISKKIITFANIYLICLFIFHFGQVVINGIALDYTYKKLSVLEALGSSLYTRATFYSLAFFIICSITILIIESRIVIENCVDTSIQSNNINKQLFLLGFVIFCISFPVNLWISVQSLNAIASGNYFDTFEVPISGIQSAISSFLIIGIILIMLSLSKKNFALFTVYLLSVAYFAWTMLSGGRGKAVIAIVLLTYIFFKETKVTWWKILLFLTAAFFGMYMLSAISLIRDTGAITLSSISNVSKTLNNPFFSTLDEFGSTLQTVGWSMRWAKNHFFRCGLTYLESLLSIFPNFGGIFESINKDAVFTIQLQEAYIGGSVIGEAYFNFGYLGIFMAVPIGVLIGIISNKLDFLFKMKSYYEIAYYVMPCYEALWWIRDSFQSMCRNVVWAALLIYAINFFVVHIKSNPSHRILFKLFN